MAKNKTTHLIAATRFKGAQHWIDAGYGVIEACKKEGLALNTYYKHKKAAAKLLESQDQVQTVPAQETDHPATVPTVDYVSVYFGNFKFYGPTNSVVQLVKSLQ